jgi:hAT family C-terminal dimerisation region
LDQGTKVDVINKLKSLVKSVVLPGRATPAADSPSPASADGLFFMPGLSAPRDDRVMANGSIAPDDEVSMFFKDLPIQMRAQDYWANHPDARRYPTLRIVARAVYGVPLTTAGVERDFSKLGKVLAKDRRSMKPETMRELMELCCNPDMWSSNRSLWDTDPGFRAFWGA